MRHITVGPAKSGNNNTVLRRSALTKVKAALTSSQVLARISRNQPGRLIAYGAHDGREQLEYAHRRAAPAEFSNIDPILQAMLASNYGVSPTSLLSLRPAPRWVSRGILRYS